MRFTLTEQVAKLVNFNPRPEMHGPNPKPAADLKLQMKLPNDVLDQLDPELKKAIYCYDKKREAEGKTDLVDAGRKHDPAYLPHLRFPKLATPLKWDGEQAGGKVTIHHGASDKSNIVLDGPMVNEFQVTPQDGGTVVLTCRVQCHPDEEQAGKVYMMVGTEITVTIEAPEADEPPIS